MNIPDLIPTILSSVGSVVGAIYGPTVSKAANEHLNTSYPIWDLTPDKDGFDAEGLRNVTSKNVRLKAYWIWTSGESQLISLRGPQRPPT